MPSFSKIDKYTSENCYTVNQNWMSLKRTINQFIQEEGLDTDPDFQRGHVWTDDQKTAYIEFKLRGGVGSNEIRFNCVGWSSGHRERFVLVDGKQRIQAVLDFFDDKIPAFGNLCSQYDDQHFLRRIDFIFKINELKLESAVLQWYLNINTTGTPHSPEEISKVKEMLSQTVSSESVATLAAIVAPAPKRATI